MALYRPFAKPIRQQDARFIVMMSRISTVMANHHHFDTVCYYTGIQPGLFTVLLIYTLCTQHAVVVKVRSHSLKGFDIGMLEAKRDTGASGVRNFTQNHSAALAGTKRR